ncbi:ATP-binding protein [Kitasatospora sp. NPDC059795]|uniref:ATP-binding protein n=1 Tax=Kitasatospora sp. NPDC059795 TaxID=3346949 RepID=UPI00364E5CE2
MVDRPRSPRCPHRLRLHSLRRLRRLRRFLPRSVRARATFAATAVVTLALGASSFALLAVLHTNLVRAARNAAIEQAGKVVESASREHLPSVLAPRGGVSVWVLGSDGTPVAATPDLLARPYAPPPVPSVPTPNVPTPSVPAPSVPAPSVPAPSVPAPSVPAPSVPAPNVPAPNVPAPSVPAPSVPAPSVPAPNVPAPNVPAPNVPFKAVPGPDGDRHPPGDQLLVGARISDRRLPVISLSVTGPDGPLTVHAAVSLRDLDAAQDTTSTALAVGVPALVLLVAAVTWGVTGRALRPVEAIRAEVAEITDRDLHRRVPVPPTGDEVARLAVTVNATLDRLEDAGLRQRRFIADASHELRSPIAVLRTQLEVALAHPDPELWPELLADAVEDTVRLQDLAADLLLLARLDAADPVAVELLDLADVFTAALAARTADRIPVAARLADDAWVLGNRTWLTRLLTNLVDNAQRYAASRVEIRLAVQQGLVVLEVGDDGPGIPAADRERVFERFTRLDDARSRELGGAGLGLAIARDLAGHHGGTLAAEPARTGARLVARLPQADPPG